MPIILAKDLLTAGAQFGHSTSHWNPKMAPYILGKRNKIHIINLRETVKGVVAAYHYTKKLIAQGKQILFVGTKRQAQELIETHARRAGMPYVKERWLGGTLTNLETIHTRVERLIELEKMVETGEMNTHSKKMQSSLKRELRKIKRNLDGIRGMHRLPGALFVVDPKHDHTAVREATRLGVPIMAVLDTDADPDEVDLPIPANDDAIRSIDLIVGRIADACLEGANFRKEHPEIARKVQEEEYQRQVAATSQSMAAYTAGARGR
ncbi:MAG: 30S ribosomal protein S2 [Planctomycetes bacterium]|nr:30S ribosomal protein S2 [Planctomycetota bacterium]